MEPLTTVVLPLLDIDGKAIAEFDDVLGKNLRKTLSLQSGISDRQKLVSCRVTLADTHPIVGVFSFIVGAGVKVDCFGIQELGFEPPGDGPCQSSSAVHLTIYSG